MTQRLVPHASHSACSFAFQRWGVGNARKILCFHGWLDNSSSFSFLGPALAESGYDVVAVDHQGHGRSSHLGSSGSPASYNYAYGPQTIKFVVESLSKEDSDNSNESVFDESGSDGSKWSKPYALIGHSMSAGMSMMFAAAFPEHLHKLVLLEGFGPLTSSPAKYAAVLRKAINSEASYRASLGIRPPKVYPSLSKAIDTRVGVVATYPGEQSLSREAAAAIVSRGARLATSNEVRDAGIGNPASSGAASREHSDAEDHVGGDDSVPDLREDVHGELPVRFRYDPRLVLPSHSYLTDEQVDGITEALQCPTLLITADKGWPASNQSAMQRRRDIIKQKGLLQHEVVPGSHHCHLDPLHRNNVFSKVKSFLEK